VLVDKSIKFCLRFFGKETIIRGLLYRQETIMKS
jgi:hypothetical protein